jgi:formylglycine-generating enzyme required for sulfatase activity
VAGGDSEGTKRRVFARLLADGHFRNGSMPRHPILGLLLSLLFAAFAAAQTPQQAGFYVNGAAGIDTPTAGIPVPTPLGWTPNIAPVPQGWRTIQYAITQVQAWMAINQPTVPTAVLYIQGGQNYSAATNGESFPIVVAPSILFEGTFIGLGFTAFPNMVPPAGVAAFSMPGNQNFFDRATVSGVRYSNSLCRYIRFSGGSVGIAMGANSSFRHNPRIEDCDFVEQTVAGIQVDTTSGINDPKIYRNNFRGCARGVDMVARGVNPILFADVEECSFESTASVVGGTGIYLLDLSSATGTASPPSRVAGLFRSNNFDRIQAGIYIRSTTGTKVRNPQIFRSRFANVVQTSIELNLAGCEGQDLEVSDCVMMRGQTGLKITGAAGGGSYRWTLDNNTYYQCSANGLEVGVGGAGSAVLSTQRQVVRECTTHGYLVGPQAPLAFSMTSQRDRLLDNVRGVLLQGSAAGSFAMRSSMVCRTGIFRAVQCSAAGLQVTLDGVTIADNNIGLDAAAYASGSSFTNLVFDGNFTDVVAPASPSFTYCCFAGSSRAGVGNLNLTSPQLDRPFYKLRPSSPCIDAGTYDAWSGATDYEGDSRTMCRVTGGPGRRDLGADEWSNPGSARPYGNVGFEQFNVFPRISSPTPVLQSPSTQPLIIELKDAVQPVFGAPGVGAVLFVGFNDVNVSLPFDLAPLGWPGSYVQVDPATSLGFLAIAQSGSQKGSTTASLPIAPGLAGVSVTAQWFVLMPPPYDVVTSDALRITVGGYAGSALPVPTNMVPIQAGTFQMGSINGLSCEAPVHQVTITRPFWIGKYEVTQAEYQAVMGSNPSAFQGSAYPGAAQRPVEGVTWTQAVQFCQQLTAQQSAACAIPAGYEYRLPTEAEWEYACRSGTATEWNVGSGLSCSQANFLGCNPTNETVAVGWYSANPWGLHDTHGNVWEWCLDADVQTSGPASESYTSIAVVDPYSTTGTGRVVRGGTRTASAQFCRSAVRFTASTPTSEIGFRIVLAPTLP